MSRVKVASSMNSTTFEYTVEEIICFNLIASCILQTKKISFAKTALKGEEANKNKVSLINSPTSKSVMRSPKRRKFVIALI